MSGALEFRMGEYVATFPTDRQYAKNHMWAQTTGDAIRFGFTAYSVRLLQDVYFLDWTVDAGITLKARQTIGSIESSKAESDLFAPVSGVMVALNEGLIRDPSTINVDNYGAGWLFEMRSDGEGLLSPEEYLVHLEASWEVAQRTIKGQANQ